MAKLGVVNLQTKNLWVEISGESPMDPGIPPLEMKNLLESKPRTSRFLVYGLAVQWSLSFFATILSLHLYLCILYIAFCSSYAFCTLYLMYRVSGSLHQILYFVHLSLWWFFLFRFWLWHSEPAWVTIQILSSWTDHISCTDCTIISLTAFQQFTNELVIACLKREVFCFFQVKLWDVGCWNDCRTTLWELTVSLLSISLPAGGEGCSSNIYIYIHTCIYNNKQRSGMFLCSFLFQQIAWNVLLSVSAADSAHTSLVRIRGNLTGSTPEERRPYINEAALD